MGQLTQLSNTNLSGTWTLGTIRIEALANPPSGEPFFPVPRARLAARTANRALFVPIYLPTEANRAFLFRYTFLLRPTGPFLLCHPIEPGVFFFAILDKAGIFVKFKGGN